MDDAARVPPLPLRDNRRTGTRNFRIPEDEKLFWCVRQVLPQREDDWDKVFDLYNSIKPASFPERSSESLCNRFKNLAKKKQRRTSTSGTVPSNVRIAQDIKKLIANQSRAGNLVNNTDEADDWLDESHVVIPRDCVVKPSHIPEIEMGDDGDDDDDGNLNNDYYDDSSSLINSTRALSSLSQNTRIVTGEGQNRSRGIAIDPTGIRRTGRAVNELRTKSQSSIQSVTAKRRRLEEPTDISASHVTGLSEDKTAAILELMSEQIEQQNQQIQLQNQQIQQQNQQIQQQSRQIQRQNMMYIAMLRQTNSGLSFPATAQVHSNLSATPLSSQNDS